MTRTKFSSNPLVMALSCIDNIVIKRRFEPFTDSKEMVISILNRSYSGFTFKKTVIEHIEELECAKEKAISSCVRWATKRPNESIYWLTIKQLIENEKSVPHECNIDYNEYINLKN